MTRLSADMIAKPASFSKLKTCMYGTSSFDFVAFDECLPILYLSVIFLSMDSVDLVEAMLCIICMRVCSASSIVIS